MRQHRVRRLVDGGSATIEHNHITHIRDNPFSGCQNGVGVQVGRFSLDATTGSATIRNNQIDDYQKNGITIDNTGSSGDVENNTIRAPGPTAVIAQNGIQVSSGATGQVKNNTVSGNVYTPGTDSSTGSSWTLRLRRRCGRRREQPVSANDIGIYAYQAAQLFRRQNNMVVNSTDDGITVDTLERAARAEQPGARDDQGVGVYATSGASLMNNQAKNNRSNGIYAGSDTSGNTFQNDRRRQRLFDCRDDSVGGGPPDHNFWLGDHGNTSSPAGICH